MLPESSRRADSSFSTDVRRQRTNLRHVSRRNQQFHRRSGTDRHAGSNLLLFVAETNPMLAELEKSDMLRQFGLILSNADGFNPSRGFVLRSAQNVQALANSMTPQDLSFGIDFSTNGRNPNPPERLGWQRWPTAPRLRARGHRAACADDAEPHTRCRLSGTDRRRVGCDGGCISSFSVARKTSISQCWSWR